MPPPTPEKIEPARFKTLPPRGAASVEFAVQFNPASLQYTISNTLKEEGPGQHKKQFVDKATAKLTMQLVFDTTDSGADVRAKTQPVAKLLKPVVEGHKQVPANVEFSWGVYRFTGMVEQYKETIDFFAASGVPLRATVDITLASQDVQFDGNTDQQAKVDGDLNAEPAIVPGGGGPASVANALGDPRAARAIASTNGASSLRFGAEGGLAIGGDVQLKAEAAFSAGASGGLGIGGGLGVGGSLGVGGGFNVGGSLGVGGGLSASAGAGFNASAGAIAGGAFAGLRTSGIASVSMPAGGAAIASATSVGAVGARAQFGLGGQAQLKADVSLGADVGAEADLTALIRFG